MYYKVCYSIDEVKKIKIPDLFVGLWLGGERLQGKGIAMTSPLGEDCDGVAVKDLSYSKLGGWIQHAQISTIMTERLTLLDPKAYVSIYHLMRLVFYRALTYRATNILTERLLPPLNDFQRDLIITTRKYTYSRKMNGVRNFVNAVFRRLSSDESKLRLLEKEFAVIPDGDENIVNTVAKYLRPVLVADLAEFVGNKHVSQLGQFLLMSEAEKERHNKNFKSFASRIIEDIEFSLVKKILCLGENQRFALYQKIAEILHELYFLSTYIDVFDESICDYLKSQSDDCSKSGYREYKLYWAINRKFSTGRHQAIELTIEIENIDTPESELLIINKAFQRYAQGPNFSGEIGFDYTVHEKNGRNPRIVEMRITF